ncbi:MAG: copper resistance protein CopC/CopD [Actinobacteria bacterium]|nr:copper resistance protein CopC/CopD [Actinomycetota bacterium]
MRRLILATALAIALAVPAAAAAHATLVNLSPSLRQELQAPPARIVLRFDQPVDAPAHAIEVLDPKGKDVVRAVTAVKSQRELVATLPKLPRGAYTVRWRALSSDGHIANGVYTFGVRVPAPPVTEAVGAGGPTRAEDIVRWLYFLGIALGVGGIGFRLLVVRGPLPPRVEKRFYWIVGLAAVGTLEVGILAFLLRAEDALQLGFVDFLYGDLSSLANGTRFGEAFIAMTLGYALVIALLYLSWLTERRWLLWGAFLVGLLFASGLSLSGHSGVEPNSTWLSELADWVHLSAAALWVGGLVQLFAVVWPAAPERRGEAFLAFSRLATVCVALVLSAGIYLSIQRLPHLQDLWRTGYGHVLLVKIALVSLALLWGGVHRQLAAPRLARDGGGTILASRLGRSLLGESAVAMSVLLLAAVLVDSKTPPQPTAPPPAAAQRSP